VRLYFIEKETKTKLYLPYNLKKRSDLKSIDKFRYGFFEYGKNIYNISEIKAEHNRHSVEIGLVLGSLLGLLAGPLGAILGGIIGSGLGQSEDKKDRKLSGTFNRS